MFLVNCMEGIYLINKIEGITSYDVIRKLKEKTTLKIGHAGTLDPFAEGLLIVLIGRATKLSDLFLNSDKIYEGVISFGYSTDTYDKTGEIVNKLDEFKLTEEAVKAAIKGLSGDISQTPPKYSSIKVKGKKLYQYARKNEAVIIPKRVVHIEFLSYRLTNNELYFKVQVSKGTYIRSIANDLGDKLGIPCHLKSLKRLSSGDFKLEDANDEKPFMTLTDYANTLDRLVIKPYLEKLVLNGVYLDDRQTNTKEIFSVYTENNQLLAIYTPFKGKYKPLILFGDNYESID